MPGVTFDRAASYYDATRGYPTGVDEQLRDAILAQVHADSATQFLELGIGTGRIALPFLHAGCDYTGIDISAAMMAELERKALEAGLPRPQLQLGDVSNMSFANDSFDVVLSVHVLHLVDDWNATLHEACRVVRPGGWIILANDEAVEHQPPNPPDQVFPAWNKILDQLGVPADLRRARAVRGLDPRFEDVLREHGGAIERVVLVNYARAPRSAREVARRFQDRMVSSSWALPEDLHVQASQLLSDWLSNTCSDPDTEFADPARIDAIVARM